MKKLYIITIIFLCMSLTFKAQDKKKEGQNTAIFQSFTIDDSFRASRLLIDALKKDGRFGVSRAAGKYLSHQRYKGGDAMSSNLRSNGPITRIFYDNEIVLDEGVDRVFTIKDIRLRNVYKITTNRLIGGNKDIYVYSKRAMSKLEDKSKSGK